MKFVSVDQTLRHEIRQTAMPKRSCKFTDELQKEFPFLKKVRNDERRVWCTQCSSEFSVQHGGRSDIKDHVVSKKHTNCLKAVAGSSKLTTFFSNKTPEDTDLELAAKEATFAYHTANHNLSFNSNVCSSKLISKFFEPKFSLGKTKCEAIILNVLAPLAHEELISDLNKSNFVSLSMDASNRKEVKLVPVVVRYFSQQVGVQVKLLAFKSVPGETAEILSTHLMSVIKENDLEKKVVCFCGDNTNTNFGGVKRRGKNNVFTLINEKLDRKVNGVGCGAHIVHNCVQHAVDTLPIDVEALVVKIYKYFHIYTVRVTQLKEFCEFAEVEYRKLLQHGNTRFLSMMPAIERILLLFAGLKEYFKSQEMCPELIKNFFNDNYGEMYLWFVHGQLAVFNKTILSMEGDKKSASDVVESLQKLQSNLKERKHNDFIPSGAKSIFKMLKEKDDFDHVKVQETFDVFYDSCIKYLQLWENSFGDAYSFTWVNGNSITWENFENTAVIINNNMKCTVINTDELFDEVVLAKEFWYGKVEEWKKKETDEDVKITAEEKWIQLFNHFSDGGIAVKNLGRVLEYIFCLPGTSAPVERIFSLMNNAWGEERALMRESTAKALIECKVNFGISCLDFYEQIKKKKDVLKKVHSSQKYEWFANNE